MPRISIGDIDLEYVDRGTGPVLLLVHGFPLDHTMWRYQLDGLADVARMIADGSTATTTRSRVSYDPVPAPTFTIDAASPRAPTIRSAIRGSGRRVRE